MVFFHKKSKIFIKSLLILFIILAIYIGNIVFFPHKMPNDQYQIVIKKDQSIASIATELENNDIIKSRMAFLSVLRIFQKDTKVAAGLYVIKNPISIWGLINRITNNKPDEMSVTILSGWTFEQLKQYIDSLENIQHISLTMSESQIKEILKIDSPNLEGVFFPSTYFIAPYQTDLQIYQQAYQTMQNKIKTLYNTRESDTMYTSPYQLIIMASLIEKETGNPIDMIAVSTVFNNRLRVGMKLQTDPTVFYGLRWKNQIKRADFQIDTPYNTYLHAGLPPTPICLPSLNALIAAANPLQNNSFFYFVAIGNGKTKFSATYDEHLIAVNKYLKRNFGNDNNRKIKSSIVNSKKQSTIVSK